MVPDMAVAEELEGAWEPADPAAFAEVLGDIPHAVFGGGRLSLPSRALTGPNSPPRPPVCVSAGDVRASPAYGDRPRTY